VSACNKQCAIGESLLRYSDDTCCQCVASTTVTTLTYSSTSPVPTTSSVCSAPQVFTTCLRACRFCQFVQPDCQDVASSCKEGCECLVPKVFNGTHCVMPEECGCRRSGHKKIHSASSVWYSHNNCKKFTCANNKITEDENPGCVPPTELPSTTTAPPTTTAPSTTLSPTTQQPATTQSRK
jgi:hypothetical protein